MIERGFVSLISGFVRDRQMTIGPRLSAADLGMI